MEEFCEKSVVTSSNSRVIGPLRFSNYKDISALEQLYPSSIQVSCLFCSKIFTFYSEKHDYLAHLYLNHRLIIGDEDKIAIFHEYLTRWHQIFLNEKQSLTEFCSTLLMNQFPDGKPSKSDEKYYLLCDVAPKDAEIRQHLQTKRLDLILAQHQYERTDYTFERGCLFCRNIIKPTRYAFIEHLFSKHYLQLGKADKLVFIDTLIDEVQMKLTELKCIFCEKSFKDRSILKEHMRKKGHKRINPENKNYDRFFLINYQSEQHKNSYDSNVTQQKQYLHMHTKGVSDDDNDSDWSDWVDDDMDIACLFCEFKSKDFTNLKDHMKTDHNIDFEKESRPLSFYKRIKMVNFVRRAMYKMECIKCGSVCNDMDQFYEHLREKNHYSLGILRQ